MCKFYHCCQIDIPPLHLLRTLIWVILLLCSLGCRVQTRMWATPHSYSSHVDSYYIGFSPQLFDVVGSCIGQPSCTEEVTSSVYSIASVVLVMMMWVCALLSYLSSGFNLLSFCPHMYSVITLMFIITGFAFCGKRNNHIYIQGKKVMRITCSWWLLFPVSACTCVQLPAFSLFLYRRISCSQNVTRTLMKQDK